MRMKHIIDNICPNIVTIIGEKKKFWSKTENVYQKRLGYIKNEINKNKDISLRKSFIDNLIASKYEKNESLAFMREIDSRVKTIYDNFKNDKNLIDKFRQILEQLILPEEKESKSYDRIAEIFSIEYLISKKQLQIIQLEYKLDNGKQIDCLLKNIQNGINLLIDFYSINVDTNKVETPELFGKFLAERIIKKYLSKIKI